MKTFSFLLFLIWITTCSAQVLQNVNGTTMVGGALPATPAGTAWTNGMTFAGVASNSSVTFVDGANAKVVISNGVIGTVKAITNLGSLKIGGALDMEGSALIPASGQFAQIQFGDLQGGGSGTILIIDDAANLVSANGFGFSGGGSLLTSLNAANISSGILSQSRFSLTNFTSYAAGTAYTLTGSSAQLTFGTTSPLVTINQSGTFLIFSNIGVKYNGATYTAAQTVTFKLRRTNNTAADLAGGSRAVELPVLTTFTGGDVMTLPPVIYTATSGDTVGIFGILSATPAAGSVLADSAEIACLRIY